MTFTYCYYAVAGPQKIKIYKYYSSLDFQLCDEAFLICNYDGSPPSRAQWLHNDKILLDGAGGANIIGGALGDSLTVIHVVHVSRKSGGRYTCNVSNSVQSEKADFVVSIHGELHNRQHFHSTGKVGNFGKVFNRQIR